MNRLDLERRQANGRGVVLAMGVLALVRLPLNIALEFLIILSPPYFLATIQVTFRDTQ